ncbi:MAG: TetR/AcrR family transcriptional regulator [Pseudomonadota bacterium]
MHQPLVKRSTREDILAASVRLFARHGYEGVSMRAIAAGVGIQAPALYYHFPDKRSLYLSVMAHAVTDRLAGATTALHGSAPPLVRLQRFVANLVEDLSGDPDLLLLLQRERLDGDEERQRLLVKEVFEAPFVALMGVMKEIAPDRDAHLLAQSVIGLVMYHLEAMPMFRFIPGWRPEHGRPDRLARHVWGLLKAALSGESAETGMGLHERGVGD